MRLEGSALPVKKLKGTDPVEMLDLSSKRLGVLSAIVIAALIKVNGTLTKIDVRCNLLDDDGKAALLKAVEGRSGFELVL